MNNQTNFDKSREIIAYVIAQLGLLGYRPAAVDSMNDDGEEKTATPEAMIEEAFAMDEAVLYFKNPEGLNAWLAVIPENGYDVIRDYPAHGAFSEAIDGILFSLEHWQCNKCGRTRPEIAGEPSPDWCRHCGSTELTHVMTPPAF